MASRKNNKTKDIVVLDDDEDSDDNLQFQLSSLAARHRRSAVVASSVVDLTGGATTTTISTNNNGRRRRNNADEVEFISSSTSSNSNASSSSSSAIQFVGTKRPLPSNNNQMQMQMNRASFPTQQNNSNNINNDHPMMNDRGASSFMDMIREFDGRNSSGLGGRGMRNAPSNDLFNSMFGGSSLDGMASNLLNRQGIYGPGRSSPLFAAARSTSIHSTNNQQTESKKKRAKSTNPKPNAEEATTAMTKGKAMQQLQGFDAIDMYYPRLKANERTLILQNILSKSSKGGAHYTKKFVHDWRVKYEKNHSKATLWSLAKSLSEEIARLENEKVGNNDNNLDQKMPAKTNKIKGEEMMGKHHQKENKPNCNVNASQTETGQAKSDEEEDDDTDKKATAPIGPISGEVLDTLTTYFHAHLNQKDHKAMLNAIEPIPDSSSPGSLSCSICADDFDAKDTVACCGESDIHFFCKPCLSSFVTVTVQSGPIQSMSCPMPECQALFATHDIKSVLSEYEILQIEYREDSRDRRVALAAKAMLHCECGIVAIVTDEDMGDGRIACPGKECGRRFCAKCGNDDHGKESCPPPAETVQWLDDHSKKCPNCSNRIEKNGGCDHMTCQPPGGCGYEFWWTCGCPVRGAHKCGLQSRFSAPWR